MWDQSVSAMFCSQEKSRKLRPNSGSGCYHRLNQKEDRHTPRVHVLKAQYKWPFTCLYNLLIFFTSTSSMSAFLFFFRTFFLCLLWISSLLCRHSVMTHDPKSPKAGEPIHCHDAKVAGSTSWAVQFLGFGGTGGESTVVDGEGIGFGWAVLAWEKHATSLKKKTFV